MVAAAHPTIWKLIDALRDEATLAEQKIDARRAGQNIRRGTNYRLHAKRILNTVEQYNAMPRADFLRSLAHNL